MIVVLYIYIISTYIILYIWNVPPQVLGFSMWDSRSCCEAKNRMLKFIRGIPQFHQKYGLVSTTLRKIVGVTIWLFNIAMVIDGP